MWSSFESPNETLHGTKMVSWNWDGMRDSVYRLDENGEVIFGVYFLLESSWSNGKLEVSVEQTLKLTYN